MQISNIDNLPFIVLDDDKNKIKIDFLSAPKNFLASSNNGYFYVNVRKNISATIWAEQDLTNIIIQRGTSYASIFSMKLYYDFIHQESEDVFIVSINEIDYVLKLSKCTLKIDENDNFLVTVNEQVASILIYKNESLQQLGFSALNVDPLIIDDTSFMPEFSIASFDDSSFTKPRPIRTGIPVISTVPALTDNTSTQEEIDYYNNGLGPIYKTIYFRVIANKILETGLSANQLSPKLRLKVYLPNGLDTVKSAIYKNIYFSSNDTTNNRGIYYSSHTFYTQGVQNNVEYVDGLMYVDVDISLTVQQSMSLQFDFNI